MENKNIEKNEVIEDEKIMDKKGNRLASDKQRKKKRQKEKDQKENVKFKFNKKKVLITVLSVLAILIVTLGVIIGTYIYKAEGNIATAALNMAADVLGEDDPIFILVLGLSEDISAELTDTIILAGYNPDTQKACMISIPRDTFVGNNEATAGGYDKINALYQKGPEKTVQAVEKLTGIKISNYVLVKNSALPAIVNAIGEVEFEVPIDMDYDDPTQNLHIHLKAGLQMIDGDEAEQLLRFRHNNNGTSYPLEYGDNDYGRMRTQREFIKAVASQLVKSGNTSNLKEIGTAVFNNVTTDMKLTKLLAYAPSAVKLDINSVRMEQLPGASQKINELWFYKHDSIETYDLINELLTELGLDEKELKELYTPTKRVKNTTTQKNDTTKKNETTSTEVTDADTNKNKDHEHSYVSKIIIEATCEGIGEQEFKCECGAKYTQEIPEKGHAIKKTETTTDIMITVVETCENEGCTYKTTKTTDKKCAHKNTSSKVVKEATCVAKGEKEITCRDCKEVFTEEIKLIGHNMQLTSVTETDIKITTIKNCSVCGHEDKIVEDKQPEVEEPEDIPTEEPDPPVVDPVDPVEPPEDSVEPDIPDETLPDSEIPEEPDPSDTSAQ